MTIYGEFKNRCYCCGHSSLYRHREISRYIVWPIRPCRLLIFVKSTLSISTMFNMTISLLCFTPSKRLWVINKTHAKKYCTLPPPRHPSARQRTETLTLASIKSEIYVRFPGKLVHVLRARMTFVHSSHPITVVTTYIIIVRVRGIFTALLLRGGQ